MADMLALNTDQQYFPAGGGSQRAEAAAVSAIYYFLGLVALVQSFFFETGGFLLELAIFGAVRGTAFVFRALAEENPSDKNIKIFVAMFAGGFYIIVSAVFFILAAWTRRIRSDGTLKKFQASLKVRTESLPRLANFIAVAFAVCGIVGGVLSYDDNADADDVDTGHKLNRAYGVGFAFLCGLLLLMTLLSLAFHTRIPVDGTSRKLRTVEGLLLFVVAFLLTLKAAWLVVSAWILRKAYKVRYFYPISTVPEMIVMIILIWPHFLSRLTGGEADVKRLRAASGADQAAGSKPGRFAFLRRRRNRKQAPPASPVPDQPQFGVDSDNANGVSREPAQAAAAHNGTASPAGTSATTTPVKGETPVSPETPPQV